MNPRAWGLRRSRGAPPETSAAETAERAFQREGRSAAETDARWQARQARVERAVWGTLAALVLAGLAILGAIVLFCRPAPVNTGDKLMDAYLQMVVDSDMILGKSSDVYAPPKLDDAQFKQLEVQFGSDPRFWMLCFYLRPPASDTYYSEDAGVELDLRYAYLEEARRRGIADGPALLRLWQGYAGEWRSEAAEALAMPPLARPPANADVARRISEINAEVYRRHAAAQHKLIGELLAAAPDEAQAHYAAAQLAVGSGDYAGALAQFRAGNAAPNNSCMFGYPLNMLLTRSGHGEYIGDQLLTGYLACLYVSSPIPSYIYPKDIFKVTLYGAVQRRDAEAMNVLQTYACRFADADSQSMINSLVGAVFISGIRSAITKDWPQQNFSPEQSKALGELLTKKQQLSAEYKKINAQQGLWSQQIISPAGISGILKSLDSQLTGGRSMKASMIENSCNDLFIEEQGLTGPVRKLVREIERFDYTKLAWE